MLLSNKTTKHASQVKLLRLVLGTGLLCCLDYGFLAMLVRSQVPIKLPRENRQTEEEEITPRPSSSPTFNSDTPPPEPTPIPAFNPVSSPEINTYRLDSGDGVSISVPLYPEFDTVGTIDSEGNILMPIVGRISITGLTISEVESKVSSELGSRFIQEPPEVFATLTLTRPAQVTVLGEVVRPGFYGFLAGSPITQVLQTAGGSTGKADLRSVVVRRNLRDGTILEQKVDLYSALIEGQPLPPVFLQGGDTIIVSQLQPGEDKNYNRTLVARSTLPQQTITVRVVFPADTGTSLRNLVLPNGSNFIDAVASLPPGDALLVKRDITLLRFDPATGGIVSQSLNPREVTQANSAQNVPLEDQDVIVVGRTLLGRIFNAFNTVTRPIRDFFSFRRFFDVLFDN